MLNNIHVTFDDEGNVELDNNPEMAEYISGIIKDDLGFSLIEEKEEKLEEKLEEKVEEVVNNPILEEPKLEIPVEPLEKIEEKIADPEVKVASNPEKEQKVKKPTRMAVKG